MRKLVMTYEVGEPELSCGKAFYPLCEVYTYPETRINPPIISYRKIRYFESFEAAKQALESQVNLKVRL